jgi:hypothetical protein
MGWTENFGPDQSVVHPKGAMPMYIKEDLCNLARRDREKGAKTAMIYFQSALQRVGFPLAFILLFILTHPYHLDCCAARPPTAFATARFHGTKVSD